VPTQPGKLTGQETGIDLGLASFATLADGTMIHNPRYSRKVEAYLRRGRRRVSRRRQGYNRHKKAVKLLAKAHPKVKRQRQDFHFKTVLALVQNHDTISYEELQTANMLRNHHLAKSISDAGWRSFSSIPAFKAAYAGKHIVAVPPLFTSQQMLWAGLWPRGVERLTRPLA
jgi:putative transposase